jgi:hypothetical protein
VKPLWLLEGKKGKETTKNSGNNVTSLGNNDTEGILFLLLLFIKNISPSLYCTVLYCIGLHIVLCSVELIVLQLRSVQYCRFFIVSLLYYT